MKSGIIGWCSFLILALSMVSCSVFNPKPGGTLSKEEMTDVLTDLQLTEGSLRLAGDSSSLLTDTAYLQSRFAEMFHKHNITPDQFSKSLDYYIRHIDELDQIYTEVLNRLNMMEAKVQAASRIKPKIKQKVPVKPSWQYTDSVNPGIMLYPRIQLRKQ